uniref:Uncharacterized protein n=1 Tax=Timspurckia oligopyrenoides TaxID=708627 RepID=A0A7S0ZHF9_9RHOD|mmetsp:Transcript_5371/g.9441  ORF Transcript_5371/g.9441 Transcript_5371/m.9441 type:complete len:232 (+) Transcript_5371:282-977(+)
MIDLTYYIYMEQPNSNNSSDSFQDSDSRQFKIHPDPSLIHFRSQQQSHPSQQQHNLHRVSISNLIHSAHPNDNTPRTDSPDGYIRSSSVHNAHTRSGNYARETPSRPKDPSRRWTPEEDALIMNWVEKHGQQQWSVFSREVFDGIRTGPQLRARYIDVLNPQRKNDVWSEDEDQLLLRLHHEIGNKWSQISDYLTGRSANDVKNRFRLLERNSKLNSTSSHQHTSQSQSQQ